MTKKERIKKYGEVFTPQFVVEKMCNLLEQEEPEAFSNIDATFLEPSCGDGVFILEILRRKFKNCKKKAEYIRAIESVYGFEIQEQNVNLCIDNVIKLCEGYFKLNKKDIKLIKDHIILCDSLKLLKLLAKDLTTINIWTDDLTSGKIIKKVIEE